MSTQFTDGSKYANVFVKELYIGANWKTSNPNEKLRLFLARNYTYPTGVTLITMVLESMFDWQTGIVEHGFITTNNGDGVIKLNSVGILSGVDCYIVVDWETPWTLATQSGDNYNGEIDFYAEIDMNAATNIDNSPTIKNYLYDLYSQQHININDIPECNFGTPATWTDFQTDNIINVSTAQQFIQAINHFSGSVTINIQNNIAMTSANIVNNYGLVYVAQGNKRIKINGNGHMIYDYSSPLLNPQLDSQRNMYKVQYVNAITGEESFTTQGGELVGLKRSDLYRSTGWVVNTGTNEIGLQCSSIPQGMSITSNDNVFITYRLSYKRFTYKITRLENNIFYFQPTDGLTVQELFRNLSPITDFYLTNYDDGGNNGINGIIIKNGYLYYPLEYLNISKCQYDYIFCFLDPQTKWDINNLIVIGGKDSGIRNDSIFHLTNSIIKNTIGRGLTNYGQVFIENNEFRNIKNDAIHSEILTSMSTPYLYIVGNKFIGSGYYGSNSFSVFSHGQAYIAHNEFIDNWFGSVFVGTNSGYDNLEGYSNLVEHNYFYFTSDWIIKRKKLGLQDSGVIYIATNNEEATIRFNLIVNCGGVDAVCCNTIYGDSRKNVAIYGDDGAYNMKIYGNIISGSENYYDIDCRDIIRIVNNVDVTDYRPGSSQNTVSTNNFIGYNLCDGNVRIQQNSVLSNPNCLFKNNFIKSPRGREQDLANIVNEIEDYISGDHIVQDKYGIYGYRLIKDLLAIFL